MLLLLIEVLAVKLSMASRSEIATMSARRKSSAPVSLHRVTLWETGAALGGSRRARMVKRTKFKVSLFASGLPLLQFPFAIPLIYIEHDAQCHKSNQSRENTKR